MLKEWVPCVVLFATIVSAAALGTDNDGAQHADVYACSATQIPTSWTFSDLHGRIEVHNISYVEQGRSVTDFHFRNQTTLPIEALGLVLEYFDAEDHVIDRIPISAGTGSSLEHFELPFAVEGREGWRQPILPGIARIVGGVKDGVRTGNCPVRAQVSFAKVMFGDGTSRTYSSPGWRVDAVPRSIPRLPDDVPPLPVLPPVSLIAELKINAAGKVVDVVSHDSDRDDLLSWVRDRMEQDWSFYPALIDGHPTDSVMTVLFVINGRGMRKPQYPKPLSGPVTFIQYFSARDLFPGTAAPDRWTVVYGSLEEGSVIN
jgi:hypothetical protein